MQKNKWILISTIASLSVLFFLNGCASAKKKQCEDQNWFEYGKAQAASGNHWNQPFFAECKREGVNPNVAQIEKGFSAGSATYCNAAAFKAAGAAGDTRNPAFCLPAQQKRLAAEYEVGLKTHCTKNGAFVRGQSGKDNLNVCPKGLQSSYNQFYLQGRSNYFKMEIVKKEQRVLAVNQRLSDSLPKEIAEKKNKKDRYDYLANKKDKTSSETNESLANGLLYGNPTTDYNSLLKEQADLQTEKDIIAKQLTELKLQQAQVEAQMMSFPVGNGALEVEKSPN